MAMKCSLGTTGCPRAYPLIPDAPELLRKGRKPLNQHVVLLEFRNSVMKSHFMVIAFAMRLDWERHHLSGFAAERSGVEAKPTFRSITSNLGVNIITLS
jgi:hypothetical protein